MNSTIISLIQVTPMLAMLVFIMQKNHFLMVLLSLEGIMLSMVLLIPILLLLNSSVSNNLAVIMLSFGACEASLGLGLLVLLSRSYGSDLLKSISSSKC